MIFGYFTLFVALLIEVVGAYYSITGLAAIFSGAVIPILIMGGVLEVGKVTAAVWLKNNWHRANMQFKLYLLPAVILLMFITSMGIFGFLSKAHNDQNLVSGDVLGKIAIYDEKIKIQRDNIDSARRALQQMDAAVDQTMSRSTNEQGADKATAIRRSQARERTNLQNEISRAQTEIVKLNDQRAPIAAEVRKVEAEVGPIKYIAKMIYGDNPDANLLESAVVWVIIMIVAVFDPLALVLILAAQQSIRWARGEDQEPKKEFKFLDRLRKRFEKKIQPNTDELTQTQLDQINALAAEHAQAPAETIVPEEPNPYLGVVTPRADQYDHIDQDLDQVEEYMPFKGKGLAPGIPMTASYYQPTVDHTPVQENILVEATVNAPGLDAADERPGDYITQPEPVVPVDTRPREAAPAPNRGIMFTTPVEADNIKIPGKSANTGFGNEFPANPQRGDVFLRIDMLPNRLYKFNDTKWIQVDNGQKDLYAYDKLYIQHLVNELAAGRYDPENLTDVEREQIQKYLENNEQ